MNPFVFAEAAVIGIVNTNMMEPQWLEPQLKRGEIIDTDMLEKDGKHHVISSSLFRTTLITTSLADVLVGYLHNVGSTVTGFELSRFTCMGNYKIQGVPGDDTQTKQIEQRITSATQEITPAMLHYIFRATVERCVLSLDVQRGHI